MGIQQNNDRIQTTHIGSLPRPHDLLDFMKAKFAKQPYDDKAYQAKLSKAVADCVRKQVDCGIDFVTDGEFSKPGFFTYVQERLEGFEARPNQKLILFQKEVSSFPEYYAEYFKQAMMGGTIVPITPVACVGPVKYRGERLLQIDIENLKAAAKAAGVPEKKAFLPATAPSGVGINEYYKTGEEFRIAIADALHEEYRAIVDAGFLLQIDDPFLVTYYITRPDLDIAACRKWAELRVEALNAALSGIPADRIRFHTCYSINMGPRIHDMQLKDIVDIILKVRAGAYSFEAANPRHEHEWEDWQRIKIPDDKILIPGVITQSTVLVEHPELVAQRLARFASVAGRERVIAGADCGFASFAGSNEVHPSIVWAKFNALVDGARLASRQLWP